MVTEQGDVTDLPTSDQLASARSFLEYVRRSSPPHALSTVARDVAVIYGNGRGKGDDPERWLIEYALDIANGDTDDSEIRQLLASGRWKLDTPGSSSEHVEIHTHALEGRRKKWHEFLAGVLGDRTEAAERFQKTSAKALEKVWVLPTLQRSGKGLKVRNHYVVLDLDAFDTFVSLLLLDEQFGGELCQCQLKNCGRFFLAKKPPTGRPQRLYCSRGHMLEAHSNESTSRARKSRAAKARKSK